MFSILIKNDQLLWVAIAYLVFVLGQNVINNFNLYYFIYVLGDAKQFSFLGVINVIIGLLAVALFPTLTEKFSRRRLFFGSVAVMLVGIVLYAMAGTSVLMTLFAAGLFALPQPHGQLGYQPAPVPQRCFPVARSLHDPRRWYPAAHPLRR